MSTPQSPSTAERAYLIWEQMGRPEGQALEHWLRAETELGLDAQKQMLSSEPAAAQRRGSTQEGVSLPAAG